jgi:5-methylthioadenosine/S-adenosylhomocysteine deaminase
VDLSGPETQPVYNPVSQLVYACNGSQVTHSWIGGQLRLRERELQGVDLAAITAHTEYWQQRITGTQQ